MRQDLPLKHYFRHLKLLWAVNFSNPVNVRKDTRRYQTNELNSKFTVIASSSFWFDFLLLPQSQWDHYPFLVIPCLSLFFERKGSEMRSMTMSNTGRQSVCIFCDIRFRNSHKYTDMFTQQSIKLMRLCSYNIKYLHRTEVSVRVRLNWLYTFTRLRSHSYLTDKEPEPNCL